VQRKLVEGIRRLKGSSVPTVQRENPIVAMVASVGGLDALGRVLRRLPGDLPAAVIALQHADPTKASHRAEILDRITPLPVTDAQDGAVLAPGTVVVAHRQGRPRPAPPRHRPSAHRAHGETVRRCLASIRHDCRTEAAPKQP
jgi:chemotaxis response regulator CheB